MDAKETCCTSCAHREICSLTEQFLKTQEAVDNVNVTLGDEPNGGTRFARLRDIQWISTVKLVCKHFLPQSINAHDDRLAIDIVRERSTIDESKGTGRHRCPTSAL
jgi:hypothetical protein